MMRELFAQTLRQCRSIDVCAHRGCVFVSVFCFYTGPVARLPSLCTWDLFVRRKIYATQTSDEHAQMRCRNATMRYALCSLLGNTSSFKTKPNGKVFGKIRCALHGNDSAGYNTIIIVCTIYM